MDANLEVEDAWGRRVLTAAHRGDASRSNRGFSELREATFVGPAHRGWRLLVGDEPLPNVAGRPGTWTWRAGFHAGEVDAVLEDEAGVVRGRWRLDVSPDPAKLGRDALAAMIAEVHEYDPALVVGREPARARLGALGDFEDPVVALLRLRDRAEAVADALRALRGSPIRRLSDERRLVAPRLVRRADRRTAMAALRQPGLLELVTEDWRWSGEGGRLALADVPSVAESLDSPANRCLLYALAAVDRRCRQLEERLGEEARRGVSGQVGVAARWPVWCRFLTALRARLETARGQVPFSEVSRAEVTSAGLNAVAADALCARLWRNCWEALRHGVAGPEAADWLPLAPTWGIFERWCFVRLGQWLRDSLPGTEWQASSSGGHALVGNMRGMRVSLHLQQTFPCTEGAARLFWSVSSERRPDLVLAWRRRGECGFWVFDAKYRVARENVLAAMASAHVYNDSLRMGGRRARGTLLLVPAPTGAAWLEAASYVREHRCGVMPLSADETPTGWFEQEVLRAMGVER